MTETTVETQQPKAATLRSLLTTEGRASRPFRSRVTAAFVTIALLHVIGLGLLSVGVISGTAGAITIGVAAFALSAQERTRASDGGAGGVDRHSGKGEYPCFRRGAHTERRLTMALE